jgi:uncharacterized heparinase superfamily protein
VGAAVTRLPSVEHLPLYVHTATRMRPRQLFGIAERKARETVLPRLPVDFDARYDRRVPTDLDVVTGPLAANLDALRASLAPATRTRNRELAREAARGEVTLLSHTVEVGDLDWTDPRLTDQPALWWTLLYAFEPLSGLVTGVEAPTEVPETVATFDEWLDGWIRTATVAEPGYLRGKWTPYCVSLRLLYWLRYLAWRGESPLEGRLAREAYRNALFLANHVEWDVDGNHLVDNGVSLVAAGVAFDEARFRTQGLRVLSRAGHDQFLADGGHYERSPMYHVATTVGYLTTVDLCRRAGHTVPEAVERTTQAAVAFCEWLRPPDGDIPLLNDAVHGYTLTLDACLRYADRVGVEAATGDRPGWGSEPTGYRWLGADRLSVLVDGGPPGPRHLPGHSHNDPLSVLCWVDDHPVLTDTGVHDYRDGHTRQYVRSVRAHNTVQVGDGEPSPIAGKYLMGPRPDPECRVETAGDRTRFEGRYRGRPARAAAYTHHRTVTAGPDWVALWDRVNGADDRPVTSRLHCHPDVSVAEGSPTGLSVADGPTLRAHPLGDPVVRTESTLYHPRFGEGVSRHTLVAEGAPSGWLLTTRDGPVTADVTGDRLTGLSLDGVDLLGSRDAD